MDHSGDVDRVAFDKSFVAELEERGCSLKRCEELLRLGSGCGRSLQNTL